MDFAELGSKFNLSLNTEQTLLAGAIAAIVVTGLYLGLLRLARGLITKLKARLSLWLSASSLFDRGPLRVLFHSRILDRQAIASIADFLIETLWVGLALVLTYFYIPIVLSFFKWTQGWADRIFEMIAEPVLWIWNGLTTLVPNLFFIAVIIIFARYLLKALKVLFLAVETGRIQLDGFHRDWARPSYQIVRIFVVLLAAVMCFPYIPGSNSPAFQGISVFLGVLVSFGSSSAISNMIAGIVMTYMRPFKPGDRVKIGDTFGDIMEKSLLVTRIRTIKNVDVTIPNSLILNTHIINYSAVAKESGLILNTTVTIGYDVPWPKVQQALIEAALACPAVLHEPKPFVFQTALNDFAVAYELNAYTEKANEMARSYSDIHTAIQASFKKHDIEIMSPNFMAIRDGSNSTIPKQEIPFPLNTNAHPPRL